MLTPSNGGGRRKAATHVFGLVAVVFWLGLLNEVFDVLSGLVGMRGSSVESRVVDGCYLSLWTRL